MAYTRNFNIKKLELFFDDTGAFQMAMRTRNVQFIDDTDGSVDATKERADQLTLAQVKALVASL